MSTQMMSTPTRLRRSLSRTSLRISKRIRERRSSKVQEPAEIIALREKVILFNEFVSKVETATLEYLQPNPHQRTKVAWKTSYSRAAGNLQKVAKYPQVEASLSRKFMKFAEGLNDASAYAASLMSSGKSFQELSAVKNALEVEIKEKFLHPLLMIQESQLQVAIAKVKISSDEIKESDENDDGKEKDMTLLEEEENREEILRNTFSESKEKEYVNLLLQLIKAVTEYHHKCASIMDTLVNELVALMSEVKNQQKSRKKEDESNDVQDEEMEDGVFMDTNEYEYSEAVDLSICESTPGEDILYENFNLIKKGGAWPPMGVTKTAILTGAERCNVQYNKNKKGDSPGMYGDLLKDLDPPTLCINMPAYF